MFLDRRLTIRPSRDRKAENADGKVAGMHGWFLEFAFQGRELAENSPVADILDALVNSGLPASARQDVHTIVNELYINALDYGVLNFNSGHTRDELEFYNFADQRQARLQTLLSTPADAQQWIKIECMLDISDRPRLELIVADSGPGIYSDTVGSGQDKRTDALGGRGLTIVRKLADKVLLRPKSNQVKVLYKC